MRTIAFLVAMTLVAVGIGLATGHPTASRSSYAYGLTGNDWWANRQQAASRALDHVSPGAH